MNPTRPLPDVTTAPSLAHLRHLDLITDSQRQEVEAHRGYAGFLALTDPAQQLLWMVEQGLVSIDDLDEMTTYDDEDPDPRERLLQRVMDLSSQASDLHAGRLLDALLKDGLLTAVQHAAARQDLWGIDFASADEMLYDLVRSGKVTRAEFDAARKRVRAEAGGSGALARLQIVEATHGRLALDAKRRRKEVLGALAHLAPLFLLVGLLGWAVWRLLLR